MFNITKVAYFVVQCISSAISLGQDAGFWTFLSLISGVDLTVIDNKIVNAVKKYLCSTTFYV